MDIHIYGKLELNPIQLTYIRSLPDTPAP